MLDRLSDRDLSILRQTRAKIAEWTPGDRWTCNFTAAESVMLLRALDFAKAAEEYLRARETEAEFRKMRGEIPGEPALLPDATTEEE